jgi:hypothetical protein
MDSIKLHLQGFWSWDLSEITHFFFEIETTFATSVIVCKYKIGSMKKNK